MNHQWSITPFWKDSKNRTANRSKGLILAVIALGGFFLFQNIVIKGETVNNGDLRILKKEVAAKAKFYPYSADGVKMEVIAVKASDGTIRTAFNTCQVCFDSGRGYYHQEGKELICNNCGNRFHIDKIEKQKNGCNPVPITKEFKSEDGQYITIPKNLMVQAKVLFGKWKK